MRETADEHQPQMDVTVEKVLAWQDGTNGNGLGGGRGDSCLGFLEKCNYVHVLADGTVWPYVCMIDVAPPLGNIHDRPLSEILHDPSSWSFFCELRDLNAACAACACAESCRGDSKPASPPATGTPSTRCAGDPHGQGFIPDCFMQRENLVTGSHSGFAEKLP